MVNKFREKAFLGIGFWIGMSFMSLITLIGSIYFVKNYDMRYSLIMLIISIIFVIMGIILLEKGGKK